MQESYTEKKKSNGIKKLLNTGNISKALIVLTVILVLYMENIQLSYSCLHNKRLCFIVDAWKIAANVLAIGFFTFLPMLFCRKWTSAAFFGIAVIFCISIINYYVVIYHGTPFLITFIRDINTCLYVIRRYSFVPDKRVLVLFLIASAELFAVLMASFITGRFLKGSKKSPKRHVSAIILAADLIALCVLFFIPNRFSVELIGNWSWYNSVKLNGYPAYAILNSKFTMNPAEKPQGYSRDAIFLPETKKTALTEESPDVIFILNESFYDISEYGDYQMDRDYLESFFNTPGAVFGKCYIPRCSTNNSEFEFLTSNSLTMLKGDVPFNYIDFTHQSKANAFSYFRELGYTTGVIHYGAKYNYNRNEAFRALPVDKVLLGERDYRYNSSNGNRMHTDEDDYKELIDMYEENKGQRQFIYVLTYQNHGEYDLNNASFDTHHVLQNVSSGGKDIGNNAENDRVNYTDELNEYISSVALSAEAFRKLTAYFEKADRPVVICMAGDHHPSLIAAIQGRYEKHSREWENALKKVPYVIWSNREFKAEDEYSYANMTDLFPMTIHAAGLPLSPWITQILLLHNMAPARYYGMNGMEYVDSNGNISIVKDSEEISESLTNYLYMEYSNIIGGTEYIQKAFSPVQ